MLIGPKRHERKKRVGHHMSDPENALTLSRKALGATFHFQLTSAEISPRSRIIRSR